MMQQRCPRGKDGDTCWFRHRTCETGPKILEDAWRMFQPSHWCNTTTFQLPEYTQSQLPTSCNCAAVDQSVVALANSQPPTWPNPEGLEMNGEMPLDINYMEQNGSWSHSSICWTHLNTLKSNSRTATIRSKSVPSGWKQHGQANFSGAKQEANDVQLHIVVTPQMPGRFRYVGAGKPPSNSHCWISPR